MNDLTRDPAPKRPGIDRLRRLTERTAELEWLFRVTTRLAGAADDRLALKELLAQVGTRMGCAFSVMYVPEKRLTLTVEHDPVAARALQDAWQQTQPHLMVWVQRRGRPLAVNQAGERLNAHARCKVLCVPVVRESGRVLGFMAFYNPPAAADFSRRHVFLARHKRLMELSRVSALAEMASGIAHELNQPLGAIATFSQAGDRLLNRPEPMIARAREVFQQINTEALNAGEGIKHIRRLFDHAEPVRLPCSMGALVEELAPALRALARSANVALTVDVQLPLPHVRVDRLRIQLVLFSLVQNALEASVLNLGSEAVLVVRSDRYAVEAAVTDSGAGVAPDLREHLFRPFFTTKAGGTGLGLASSRATIEAHEGTIGFDPALPGGSRFWFRLPIEST